MVDVPRPAPADDRLAAVVLAGGRSSRFGTDKLSLAVDGRPLLLHAVDAALTQTTTVLVVGDPAAALPDGVSVVPDSERHAGPYAAVRDGLDALPDACEVVLVLAGDLLAPGPLLPRLLAALEAPAPEGRSPEAAVAVDDEGRRQPLLAAYRVDALLAGIAGVDPYHRAAYALLDGLHVVEVLDTGHATRDVDTPADLP